MKKYISALVCVLIAVAVGAGTMAPNVVKSEPPKKTDGEGKYPPCNGPKKRISVYHFKDGVNNQFSAQFKNGILEALQYELQQTNCFIVLITNEDMDDSAAEIRHGQSGMARGGNRSPQAGQQLGAQMIVAGTIYEATYTGGQSGGVKLPGSITGGANIAVGGSKQEAKVVLMIKFFDPETRIMLFNEKAEGAFNKQSVAIAGTYQGGAAATKIDAQTPVGDAAMKAIRKAVKIIVRKMNELPWQATVLKVEGNRVLIRGGTPEGVQTGMILDIYQPGEKIEDPDTGEILQEPAKKLGSVRVTQVAEKMSYCEILSGPVQAGMWARMQMAPVQQ